MARRYILEESPALYDRVLEVQEALTSVTDMLGTFQQTQAQQDACDAMTQDQKVELYATTQQRWDPCGVRVLERLAHASKVVAEAQTAIRATISPHQLNRVPSPK